MLLTSHHWPPRNKWNLGFTTFVFVADHLSHELAGMERVSDSPRPTTTADTAPKRVPTLGMYRTI